MTYKTISEAVRAAEKLKRDVCIVGSEGDYALTEPQSTSREDVYMTVTACGQLREGPKALELPINAP